MLVTAFIMDVETVVVAVSDDLELSVRLFEPCNTHPVLSFWERSIEIDLCSTHIRQLKSNIV